MATSSPQENFRTNLRLLLGSEASTAALCRSLEINRQQFNKYLAGSHLPSRRNLALISRHFGVADKDLFLPPDRFEALHAMMKTPWLRSLSALPTFGRFERLASLSNEAMSEMLGVYTRYHCSSIYDRRVLRSIASFHIEEGMVRYHCVERFQNLDKPSRTACRFRYEGICTFIKDRLFLMDLEGQQLNEMTFTVLVPIARKPFRFLFGTLMGVAATPFREPFATRVAYEFRHHGSIKPSDLRLTSAVEVDDPTLPFEVKTYLGVGNGWLGEIIRGR